LGQRRFSYDKNIKYYMCGIAGVFGPGSCNISSDFSIIQNHRGPDNYGYFRNSNILLAHNRLAIIDLNINANQPFADITNRYVIIFNGEIYNYKELKSDLLKSGFNFRSNSDTEVLLYGYIKYGSDILPMLNGMFSFAIYDNFKNELFVARDHVGIKPLYYFSNNENLIFASEIKVILDTGIDNFKISNTGILNYLNFGYSVGERTIYNNISCLLPGHFLFCNISDNSFKLILSKWYFVPKFNNKFVYNFDQATKTLKSKISESVQSMMISDVPVAAFLSGGIDSSIIVSEMCKHSVSKVPTFSIGYNNKSNFDESYYIKMMISKFNISNEIIYPNFTQSEIYDYIDIICDHLDQPYANPTVILSYLLTKKFGDQYKVMLIGDGADELFGGYPRHWAMKIYQRNFGLFNLINPCINKILNYVNESPQESHFIRRLRKFTNSNSRSFYETYLNYFRLFSKSDLEKLSKITGVLNFNSELFKDKNYIFCVFSAMTRKTFLPFNLLEGADKISIANSF